MKILTISGHGAGDCGATGCGYTENDLTIKASKSVSEKLRALGHEVIEYPHDRDAFQDVCNGKFYASLSGVDYALEFHFNACVNDQQGDGRTTGTEIYVTSAEKGYTVEEAIVANIASFGLRNRGVKKADYTVINYIKNRGVSSALLEMCFIDDKDDMDVYIPNADKIASKIAEAIHVEFGCGEATPAPTPAPAPQPTPTPAPTTNTSFLVRIDIGDLRIRKGAGTNYGVVGYIPQGVYTIVETANGEGAKTWGRLKSGAGWIALDYAKRI